MTITVSAIALPLPVTILHLQGSLDSSNHQILVDEAHRQKDLGSRRLVFDLRQLTFISSAGLSALHKVALDFRDETRPADCQTWSAYRWAAFRSMKDQVTKIRNVNVRLSSPSQRVWEVLEMIRFTDFFRVYPTLQQAVASFSQFIPLMTAFQ
jgi:anti-anti-sigma regulatory factor